MQEFNEIALKPRRASEIFFGLELDSITKQEIVDENIKAIQAGLNNNEDQQRYLDHLEDRWLDNPDKVIEDLINSGESAFQMGPLAYFRELYKGHSIEFERLKLAYAYDQTLLVHDYCKNHYQGEEDWEILSNADKILRAQIVKDTILETIKNNTTDQRLIKGFRMISAIDKYDESALKKAVAGDEFTNINKELEHIIHESDLNAMGERLEAASKVYAAQDPIMEDAFQDFKTGLREADPFEFAKLTRDDIVAKMEQYRHNDEMRLCLKFYINAINHANDQEAFNLELMNALENTTVTGWHNWVANQQDLTKEILVLAGIDIDTAGAIARQLWLENAGTDNFNFEAVKRVLLKKYVPELESEAEAQVIRVIRNQSEQLIIDGAEDIEASIVDDGEDALSTIVNDVESDLEALLSDG